MQDFRPPDVHSRQLLLPHELSSRAEGSLSHGDLPTGQPEEADEVAAVRVCRRKVAGRTPGIGLIDDFLEHVSRDQVTPCTGRFICHEGSHRKGVDEAAPSPPREASSFDHGG